MTGFRLYVYAERKRAEKQCSMGKVRKSKKDRSSPKHKSAKSFKNTTINRHIHVQIRRKQCTHGTDTHRGNVTQHIYSNTVSTILRLCFTRGFPFSATFTPLQKKKKKAEHPQTKWKHKKAQNKVESKRKVQINCEVQNSNDSESAGTKNRKHTQGDTRRLWSRIR